MEYRPLKKSFQSKGFTYEELTREGDLAIYKQTSRHGRSAYEVIRIRRHNGYSIAGIHFPPAEMYPSNSQWGNYGWTCTTLDDAIIRFNWAKKKFTETKIEETASEAEIQEIVKDEDPGSFRRNNGKPGGPKRRRKIPLDAIFAVDRPGRKKRNEPGRKEKSLKGINHGRTHQTPRRTNALLAPGIRKPRHPAPCGSPHR